MQALFVSGVARSGTTLMQGLLCNSAATMENSKECSYFRALIESYYLAAHSPFSMHTSDYFTDKNELRDFHREILRLYFEHLEQRLGKGIPVQKEPSLLNYFPDVGELMEDAMFIVMVRDPRDLLVSQMKRYKKSGQQLNFQRWYEQQFPRLIQMIQRKATIKDRCLFVRYESLCERPKDTLMEIDGVFSKRGYMLNLSDTTEDTSWNSKRQSHEESASDLDGKPISASSVGAFESILDRKTLAELQKLQPILQEVTGIDWFCSHDRDLIHSLPSVVTV